MNAVVQPACDKGQVDPGVTLAVYVGHDPESLVTTREVEIECDFGGVVGDRHHGYTMPSNSRQSRWYERGTEIRNRRQVSLVSFEELALVAGRLGLPSTDPELLGANVTVSGIPDFSQIPMGTRLVFSGGVVLVVESVNQPCRLPGLELQRTHPGVPGLVKQFPAAARGYRGVVASVEHPGNLAAGETITVFGPELHTFGSGWLQ